MVLGEFQFVNYLPMQYLTASRSSQTNNIVMKSQFYDFLPSELEGKKPNYLEIRSIFPVR